ncbi:glycerate kinase [Microaerobacter geothermalis]|nr:glycerate kinase [Microaerobacter geothermalis]
MKIVLAPDSFKGSLTAKQAAEAMKRGILKIFPEANVKMIPLADGGEGTVEAIVASVGGRLIKKEATGPLGKPVSAFFGLIDNGKTAVIEMASASGLTLVPPDKRNPLLATSYGTGELIKAAMDEGVERIIIGIGGSATNDGGVGMAAALGYQFLDIEGNHLPLGAASLPKLHRIDPTNRDPRIQHVEFTVACDVKNTLCGEKGASAVFGPQKGATTDMIIQLDQELEHLGRMIKRDLNVDVFSIAGGGAAGGMGAGLIAFCNARLQPGIDFILDICRFDEQIEDADLIITGEGQTDEQSVMGKAPVGVSLRAKKYQIPVICLSGSLGKGYEEVYQHGIDVAFSIIPAPIPLQVAMEKGEIWVEKRMESIMRVFSIKTNNIRTEPKK